MTKILIALAVCGVFAADNAFGQEPKQEAKTSYVVGIGGMT